MYTSLMAANKYAYNITIQYTYIVKSFSFCYFTLPVTDLFTHFLQHPPNIQNYYEWEVHTVNADLSPVTLRVVTNWN